MPREIKLAIPKRVYEGLKGLLKENVFVDTFVESQSRSFARGIIIDGQRITATTVEKLIHNGVLEFIDDVPRLTEKGISMIRNGEGLRVGK
jgi:hypothetical protein